MGLFGDIFGDAADTLSGGMFGGGDDSSPQRHRTPGISAGDRQQIRRQRASAKWGVRAKGGSGKEARQAGRTAAQAARSRLRTPLPQPPAAPPPPDQGGGTPGGFEYNQPVADALSQPYADVMAAGGIAAAPQMFDLYGQQGQLSGGFMDQSGQTLGDYGQLMNPNLQIQQNLANQVQAIQTGQDSGFDPLLDQQLGDQERVLHEQLRRQLGPDYANSSAGIEALGKFGQLRQTTLGTSRFNQLQGLMGQQQAGLGNLAGQANQFGQVGLGAAGQAYNQGMGFGNQAQQSQQNLLNRAGQTQDLFANIPRTMGQFGQAMSDQSRGSVLAQQPYQQDRYAQLQTQYAPTQGSYAGGMMAQSGDRWAQIGSNIGGMGGGGGNPSQQGQQAGYG